MPVMPIFGSSSAPEDVSRTPKQHSALPGLDRALGIHIDPQPQQDVHQIVRAMDLEIIQSVPRIHKQP